MKNKKLLYVLIPGVIFVWGAIIYKIIGGVGDDDKGGVEKLEMAGGQPNEVLSDTFSIHPTYRDPFSGKQVKKAVASLGSAQVKKAVIPVIAAKWPEITYGGIVKNQKSNKQLVLVTINGQSTMMIIGEIYADIELLKVFRDSIEVKFVKEKKYIRK